MAGRAEPIDSRIPCQAATRGPALYGRRSKSTGCNACCTREAQPRAQSTANGQPSLPHHPAPPRLAKNAHNAPASALQCHQSPPHQCSECDSQQYLEHKHNHRHSHCPAQPQHDCQYERQQSQCAQQQQQQQRATIIVGTQTAVRPSTTRRAMHDNTTAKQKRLHGQARCSKSSGHHLEHQQAAKISRPVHNHHHLRRNHYLCCHCH
mmetsp:Transcript_15252/g.23968  ORF Transcript_15252/g.23968 Transcript_15252/m.23968 type:complete len:207 (+) Transcript_15252:215-835(+)